MGNYLTDLTFEGENNMGGLLRLELISSVMVEEVPFPINGKVLEPIVLKNDASIKSWYIIPQTGQFTNRQTEGMEGPGRGKELNFAFPKDQALSYEEKLKASHDSFIIIYTDMNGLKRIWGDPFFPVFFSFDQDSGRVNADRNGYTCKFYDDAPDNLFVYDPST